MYVCVCVYTHKAVVQASTGTVQYETVPGVRNAALDTVAILYKLRTDPSSSLRM